MREAIDRAYLECGRAGRRGDGAMAVELAAVGLERRVSSIRWLARLRAALDVEALIEVGWDPGRQVFAPSRDHPIFGFRGVRGAGLSRGSAAQVKRAVQPVRASMASSAVGWDVA